MKLRRILPAVENTSWSAYWRSLESVLNRDGLRRAYEEELQAVRAALYSAAASPRFLNAVANSSPAAAIRLTSLETSPPRQRNSAIKRLELLAVRYCQRFAARCETTAFIGPVATGHIASTSLIVDCQWNPNGYRGRGFLSERSFASIVAAVRATPEVARDLRVRRRPAVLLKGQQVFHPHCGTITIDSCALYVLKAATEGASLGDIAAAGGFTFSEVHRSAFVLLQLGLLSDALGRARSAVSPPRKLLELAGHRVSDETRQLLVISALGIERWPDANWNERAALLAEWNDCAAAAGIDPANRKQGFYGDHLPWVEDGLATDSELVMDQKWAEPFLRQLDSALRRGLAPSLGPFVDGTPGVRFTSRTGEDSRAALFTPDVMIAATDLDALRAGRCHWVLSEVHSGLGLAGFHARVLNDRSTWLHDLGMHLESALHGTTVVVITPSISNKTFHFEPIPGVKYLDAGDDTDDGSVDGNFVCTHGAREQLEIRRADGQPCLLLPGPQCKDLAPALRPLSYVPPRTEGRTYASDSLVVARQRWILSGKNLPLAVADAFEVFAWAQLLRSSRGLPRWVFAHFAGEAKPICIDFSSPLLCEELLRQLRRCSEAELVEMLPSPDQAWVEHNGERYLSELRLCWAGMVEEPSGGAYASA